MTRLLYINTLGKEGLFLRISKKLLSGKDLTFNSPDETLNYINTEHPNLIMFDSVDDKESMEETLSSIDFSTPVKSISFPHGKLVFNLF